ncbi:50S ribosomal protein L17 [Patescibacteria group bacterium]|nr:50S ribosomal protein L17 [Patescibacteria group bacterium]
MRKNIFGRKFKRDINKRKALFKHLMSSLVLDEKIKTTEAKAKAIKGEVDKLITKAKKEEILARKLLSSHLTPKAIDKLLSEVAPRFKERHGGYARVVKTGRRLSDGARMALIEWTESAALKSSDLLDKSLSTTATKKVKVRPVKKKTQVKKPSRGKAPRAKQTKLKK